jgi:hypothetical protein
MSNENDILKRILLNMRYDSSMTLTEQPVSTKPEVTVTAKKQSNLQPKKLGSIEGNPSLDGRKIVDCKTGKEYISPNFSSVESFKNQSTNEYIEEQKKLLSTNKTNELSACRYYVTIIKDQISKKTGIYAKPSNDKIIQDQINTPFEDLVYNCINNSYLVSQNKPGGCTVRFSYFSKNLENQGNVNPFYNVSLVSTSWFLTEYKKYQTDNNYTPQAPYLIRSDISYSYTDQGKIKKFNIEDIKIDSTGDKDLELETSAIGGFDLRLELPLTSDEKMLIDQSPISQNNEFIGGEYICKKPGVNYVNLRTTNEVNDDTGYFDPTDNFISWSNDEIVGKYLSQKNQNPVSPFENGQLRDDKESKKFYNNIINSKSEFNNLINHLKNIGFLDKPVPGFKGKTMRDVLLSGNQKQKEYILAMGINNADNFYPENLYKKVPKKYKSMLWYKVEFLKPLSDIHEGGINYKEGWVREDNVEFCKKPTDVKSQTNYENEFLKRVPIKPLANPIISKNKSNVVFGDKSQSYTRTSF